METKITSKAKIISYNIDPAEICASAARISTTKGTAEEIFEKSKNNAKNSALIQKVLASGHQSVIEHMVFTIAFCNVSAYVEQFFIECRLASFTVKSRRYVDFSSLGYHIPADLEGEDAALYCGYMDMLFTAYHALLEEGVPKEDARFLLPYSFHSNFYCTVNARELVHMLSSIRFGHGKNCPELQLLADQLSSQLHAILPDFPLEALFSSFSQHTEEPDDSTVHVPDTVSLTGAEQAGTVRMLNGPSDPLKILETAYQTSHPYSKDPFDLTALLHAKRPRELEQLSYTFLISDITLSGITHIVRHRMQSVLIPCIQNVCHSRYIFPDSVKNNICAAGLYKNTLEKARAFMQTVSRSLTLKKYSYYFALSGNTLDIMTTMNARQLHHFIRLRTCNRAQWEIRKISIEMLKQLRNSAPKLFRSFGPGCYTNGVCPEGSLTCQKMEQVTAQFRDLS